MRAAVATLAISALIGAADAEAGVDARAAHHGDPVLRDVERAFAILRADRPAAANRARALLAPAAAALDDLADERDSLRAAVGGDDAAAWRGLPHERVLILLTLAALDVDAGRCDLALPTLKNALHHRDRGRLQHGQAVDDRDLALATVLRGRCALKDGVGDVDAARTALLSLKDGAALLAAVTAPSLVLAFSGRAPGIAPTGAHGEQGQLVWGADDDVAFILTIGPGTRRAPSSPSASSSSSSLVVHDLKAEALPPGPAATARRSAAGAKKSQLRSQATQYASRGQGAAQQARDARGVIGAGLLLGAAAGLTATTAVVDTRVDTRTAASLPARIAVRLPA